MKKALYILIPLVLVLIVGLRLRANRDKAEQRVYRYDRERTIYVRADTLELVPSQGEYSFTGSFEAERETKVSAEVQGKVNAVYVDAGAVVKKGQPLVQLDNSLLRLQVEALEVQIEGLSADVERYTVLATADAIQGVQLEKAELGLRSARIQRSTLLEQIAKTTIRAPFAGVVTARLVEAGAYAAPGVPLVQISDLAQLRFTIAVPEADVGLFTSGTVYRVVCDAFPGESLDGRLTLIGSKAGPSNSFPVQFTLKNTADLRIRAGMFGKVHLRDASEKARLVVPSSAIAGSAVRPRVYQVVNGKAIQKDIVIARRTGNSAIVESGLTEGDVIVTGGFINLFDGANVEVKE
jgi:membrane fusion protein, multidrug efflux system